MLALISGISGQVGSCLTKVFEKYLTLDSDFQNLKKLHDEILDKKPSIILNPAAYTAVDLAESERQLAQIVNCDAVKIIAECAKILKIPVIHFSTDYVYPGTGENFHLETDPTNPQNHYGATKLAGESYLTANLSHYYIFRTSWVFHTYGKNFINTILKLASEREHLKIINDQFGSPTSAEFLAKTAHYFAVNNFPSGIYHATCAGICSWYDFAQYIVSTARELGFPIKTQTLEPIPTASYPTAAKRPLNSRLSPDKLEKVLNFPRPSWQDETYKVLLRLKM